MTEVLNTGLLPESGMLYETVVVVITGIFAILGMYLRNFLQTNSKAVEYNLYNERTERILANALAYAETAAKGLAKSKLDKKDVAKEYIKKVAPDIIDKEGDKLNIMLDRKEVQINK